MKNTKLEEELDKRYPLTNKYKDHDAIQKMNRGSFTEGANYQAEQTPFSEEFIVEFLEYIKADFDFSVLPNDEMVWRLSGTEQRYTSKELLELYQNQKNERKNTQ